MLGAEQHAVGCRLDAARVAEERVRSRLSAESQEGRERGQRDCDGQGAA